MAEQIGTAYIQIIPSFKGVKTALKDGLSGDASQVGKRTGSDMGKKAGSGFAGALKAAVAAAGIGKILSVAFNQGAALQQSLGGIETLYKASADRMKKYASESFKTTGLSANEYMENVTSFSASMISSLGGNTKKAADLSNQAMTDMSDNVNKMGSDMSLITQTYQSLARGNYAMLDNLKLGYGGTKKEMQRLLQDAQKISGQKYDISKFSDVTQAIHVIQTQLGITGTTAKEAATTFSGSFSAMKAAALDLAGNIAIGKNIKPALKNLLTTVNTFVVGNFLPMLGTIGSSVSELITTELPKVGPAIVNALKTALSGGGIASAFNGFVSQFGNVINTILTQLVTYGPQILTMGVQLIANLSKGLVQGIPQLATNALNILDTLANNLLANAPKIIQSGYQMLSNLVQGITNALPILIARLPEIISKFADVINNNAPTILAMGAKLIMQLAQGIVQSIPVLVANLPKIFEAIVKVFSAIQWLSLGKMIIDGIKVGLSAGLSGLVGATGKLSESILNGIKSLPQKMLGLGKSAVQFLGNAFKGAGSGIASAAKTLLTLIVNGLKVLPSKLITVGKTGVTSLGNAIKSGAGSAGSAAKSVLSAIVNGLKSLGSKLASLAKKAVSLLAGAVRSGVGAAASAAKAILSGVVNAIRSMPSKLMSLARNAVSKMASAINPGTVVAKMKALGNSAVSAVKNLPSQFVSVGKNIVMGVVRGIAGAAGSLYNKIKSTMSGMVPKAMHALGIKSPSRVFANKVGKYIPLGVNKGIESTIGTSYALVERYGKNLAKKASSSVNKANKKATKNVGASYAQSVISSTSHYKVTKSTKTKKDKKTKKSKKVTTTKKTKLTSDQYGSQLIANAKSKLSVLEAYNKITYKQEVTYWQKIKSQLKKGSKAYNTAMVNIAKAKKNKSTADSKKAKEFAEKQENYISGLSDSLDLKQKERNKDYSDVYKMSYWKKAMKNVAKGSTAWKTAYSNYLDARNSAKNTAKELASTYKDAIAQAKTALDEGIKDAQNDLNENITKVNEDLASNIQSAQESLTEKTTQLMDSYKSAVSERANAIASAFNITDKVTLNLKTGKKTLMKNLQDQVNTIARYSSTLSSLRAKLGDNSDLYKQLAAMSPSDVKTLESVNEMSAQELAQYQSLLAQKNALSNQVATADNQTLLAQTQANILQAQNETNTAIAQMQATASAQIAQYKVNYDNTVAQLKATAQTSINTATSEYVNGLKAAGQLTSKSAKKLGKQITKGVAKGMLDNINTTDSAISELCDKLIAKAKSKLKIKSPSRVFANVVGKFIPLGLAKGINANTDVVYDTVKRMATNTVTTAQAALNYQKMGIPVMTTSQVLAEANRESGGSKMDLIIELLSEIVDKDTAVYLDSRKVSKQLVKPLNKELGALKKWQG